MKNNSLGPPPKDLSCLSSDILYEISTHLLPSFPQDAPLQIVLECRRCILYPLLFVCRSFRAAFEPLLYHSVAVCYDELFRSGAGEQSSDWVNVEVWVKRLGKCRDRTLWRVLEDRKEVGWWVRRMELEWEYMLEHEGSGIFFFICG